MHRRNRMHLAAWVAVVNVVAAPQLSATEPAAASARAQALSQAFRVVDVEMDREGAVVGQVVSAQGRPVAGKLITLDNGSEQIQLASDAQGAFRATGIRSGVYRVQTARQSQLCRLWQPGTAPPRANRGLMLVQNDRIALGQNCGSPVCDVPNCGSPVACSLAGCKQALAHPLIFGGIVAAAIAIPVAIHNSNDDDPPAS